MGTTLSKAIIRPLLSNNMKTVRDRMCKLVLYGLSSGTKISDLE